MKENKKKRILKKKTNFMGILANIDSTITKIKLNHGFKIEEKSSQEVVHLISTLENISIKSVNIELIRFNCISIHKRKIYLITNSFDVDSEADDKLDINTMNAITKFDNKLFDKYLDSTIRLMRLYKEGNIFIPIKYYFSFINDTPKLIICAKSGRYVSSGKTYSLKSSDLSDLYIFIKNTKIPFMKSFLQFAFENFELSYHTKNINLSFLSLMMSLESLFNPGEQELRYRISRNAAVLLGRNKKEFYSIFAAMKRMYDKRSKIVHRGEKNVVNENDLVKFRDYVRRSIIEMNKIGKEKTEILNILNSSGFDKSI